MNKKNIWMAILLVLICLAGGIGIGYVLFNKTKEEKKVKLNDLNGYWLDCNEKRGYDNCNYSVLIDNNSLYMGLYGTDGIFGGEIIKSTIDRDNLKLKLYSKGCTDEEDCMEISEDKYYEVEIDSSEIKNKKIIVTYKDEKSTYYYAGNTPNEVEQYINNK